MKKILSVPSFNLQTLISRLTELAAKAADLGVPAIQWTVGEGTVHYVKWCQCEVCIHEKEPRTYYPVTVEGEAPKFNGWQLVAALEHTPAGNVVRGVPGLIVPERYRTAANDCDHCQLARKRSETFVVFSETEAYKQVGRSCIADFLGHSTQFLEYAEYVREFESAFIDADEPGGFGHRDRSFDAHLYLAYVGLALAKGGWVSRTQARESINAGSSTADLAVNLLFPSVESKREYPTKEHFEEASAALAWVKSDLAGRQNLSDYEHNLVMIASKEAIEHRDTGIIASLIPAHRRALGKKLEQQKRAATSQHFGTVGKREEFTLTVSNVYLVEGNYGVTKIHTLLDAAGNVAVWFSSSKQLKQGVTYVLKATVKSHGERNGVKQTVLTRAAVVLEDGKAVEDAA